MLRANNARPQPKLKSPREIGLMREAGRVVARALARVRQMAVPGVTTAQINDEVAAIYREIARSAAVFVAQKAEDFSHKFPTIKVLNS